MHFRYKVHNLSDIQKFKDADIAYRIMISKGSILIFDLENNRYKKSSYAQSDHISSNSLIKEKKIPDNEKSEFIVLDTDFPDWADRNWLGNEIKDAPTLSNILDNWEKFPSLIYRTNVPLKDVIGTNTAFEDYDSQFKPKRHELDDRWKSIYFFLKNQPKNKIKFDWILPIDFVKFNNSYFVDGDGNKRTAILKLLGFSQVFADVTEIITENQ